MKNIGSSYQSYIENSDDPVDRKTYMAICKAFMKFIMDKVMGGYEISLPAGMGTLSIIGRKIKVRFNDNGTIKGMSPNWKATKDLWASNAQARGTKQLVYHTNEHSDMIRYKFYWRKAHMLVTNKGLFTLVLSRTNKRDLATRIKAGAEYPNMR